MDETNLQDTALGLYPDKPEKELMDSETLKYMKKYLVAFKNLKDVKYDVSNSNPKEEKGFIEALKILYKWFANNSQDVTAQTDGYGYHIHEDVFIHKIKSMRAVLWAQDNRGVKSYYTISFLSQLHGNQLMNALTGLENAQDDYQGLNLHLPQEQGARVVNTIGVSFFQQRRQNSAALRKAEPLTGQTVNLRKYKVRAQPRMYNHASGAFFPFICTLNLDLSCWGIYSEINKNNYKDNCFVHACAESGVFSSEEVDALRAMIRCRRLPRKEIKNIAETMKCNFIVSSINEEQEELKNQISSQCNTIKQLKKEFDRTVHLILYKDHYLLYRELNISPYAINHYESLKDTKEWWKVKRIRDSGRIEYTDKTFHPLKILRALFAGGFFRPITAFEQDLIKTPEFKNKLEDYDSLEYAEEYCCRPMVNTKTVQEYDHILYADFESDVTVNPHKAYLCCVVWMDKEECLKRAFRGAHCAMSLLNFLPNKSLVYFHNLKYDASFFMNVSNSFYINFIQRSGTILQIVFTEKGSGRRITFRDSYSIIPAPLKKFGDMFNLEVVKEVCPYKLYTEKNIKRKFIPIEECLNQLREEGNSEENCKQFYENCVEINCIHEGRKGETVEIMEYAEFYCTRDCVVLMQGLQKFNEDLEELFKRNGKEWYGLQSYVSISSIGYHFAQLYGCMDGCYELAGKPQDFISRCVTGGRTMCAHNKKQLQEGRIQDFDAVSLYPSAMSIMTGIPKGKPKVLTPEKMKNIMKLDAFYVEIKIKSIKCIGNDYPFPLLFKTVNGTKIFVTEPLESFYVDKRGLQDLKRWYFIDYEIIRGYYFDEGFNTSINTFIKELFNLRRKYQEEGNPLEKTLKLLLNSIYGKSILKPISTETVVIDKPKIEDYVIQHYNYITELTEAPNCKHAYAKLVKPINTHFNLPQFGVGVLSWSKHIMNNVMCLAAISGIPIYYQDTDSMHLDEENVAKLAKTYEDFYGRKLIGTELTQFHCDFEPIKKGVPIHSRKLIALGKKSYLDILQDDEGNESYHIRMKGIPQPVIYEYCEKNGITIEELYMKLYEGENIEFNLLEGSNCFRKNKCFEMYTPEVFKRNVHF